MGPRLRLPLGVPPEHRCVRETYGFCDALRGGRQALGASESRCPWTPEDAAAPRRQVARLGTWKFDNVR